MRVPEKKSLGEHKEYVEELARVSFFFAQRWMKERMPEKSIGEILRDHTPLFHHALEYHDHETKWDNPDCLRIMEKANELQDLPASTFEERMYENIKALAMERAERFYSESVGIQIPSDWNVGSLKYDPPRNGLPRNYCNFHIANAVSPKSIFDDPEYLPECFMELMDRSEKEYGYDTLHTSTWLNDNPRWLALFPNEWKQNLSPRNELISWHFGYWGQLITARGTFNVKAGKYVREHGDLKYGTRSSHCSFIAMRDALSKQSKSSTRSNTTIRRLGKFTLVELMVVISIIAILSSMLLPALKKARDKL